MRCSICGRDLGDDPIPPIDHLPIYVDGSEGIDICFPCRMAVTEFLRSLKQACARSRMALAKSLREVKNEKSSD